MNKLIAIYQGETFFGFYSSVSYVGFTTDTKKANEFSEKETFAGLDWISKNWFPIYGYQVTAKVF